MVERFHLSERRACRLVGLSRDSYRHPPQETEMNQALSAKIIEIAHVRSTMAGFSWNLLGAAEPVVLSFLLP